MFVSVTFGSKRRALGTALPSSLARSLFAAMYLLYPVGCILQLGPDDSGLHRGMSLLGLILIAASLVVFGMLAFSNLQRQTQEPEEELDERELMQRNRASHRAYSLICCLVLLGVLYLMLRDNLAGGLSLWAPTTPEHWNGIFWGLLLLSLTLPAAFLAWEKEPPPLED